MKEYKRITTKQIIETIVDKQGLTVSPKGYICNISLYNCNLREDFVHMLFGFEIDLSISFFRPDIVINIPNGECSDIFEHDYKYSNKIMKMLLKLIPTTIQERYGNELSYVTFSVLHEIGHWKYLCDMNWTANEYQENDSVERKYFLTLFGENIESEDAFLSYRQISSEKAADKYAFSKLENCLERIVMQCEV